MTDLIQLAKELRDRAARPDFVAPSVLKDIAKRIESVTNCNQLNMAKARESLEEALKSIDRAMKFLNAIPEHCGYDGLVEDAADEICALREVCTEALSSPPRNCDRFGTDNVEALLAYEDICEKSETEESVSDAFSWLFALAESEGTK